MRSIDRTEIEQDNEIPTVQVGVNREQVEGESRQLQEEDVEMKIMELPIKENFLEIPDSCKTDSLETEMGEDNPTPTPPL